MEWSFLVEVDPGLLGHGVEAVLLDGLEGLGGEAELDVALAGLPPELLVLQVDELLLLGLVVGERHFVCPVGLLLQERADPARDDGVLDDDCGGGGGGGGETEVEAEAGELRRGEAERGGAGVPPGGGGHGVGGAQHHGRHGTLNDSSPAQLTRLDRSL